MSVLRADYGKQFGLRPAFLGGFAYCFLRMVVGILKDQENGVEAV